MHFTFFEARNDTVFDKKAFQKPPFIKNFVYRPIELSSRHSQLYIEPKILGVVPKLSPLWDLRVMQITFSKCKMTVIW